MSIVDQENKLRMAEGFMAKFGEPMDDDEYRRLLSLAKLSKMDPMVNTFAEIDGGIKTISKKWKPRKSYAKA